MISLLDPLIGRLGVDTIARFVPQRPDDHGRVVLVPFDHPLRAIHVRQLPGRVLGERFRVVTHAVGLDVRLVNHIHP